MFKPRLRRLEWLYTDRPLYFLTTCVHDRRRLLDNESIHRAFMNFCGKASAQGVWVGRYVLMPDHVHLFAAFAPSAPSLSCWMKALKRTLALVVPGDGVSGPCWQKGFFDHVLRSAESYRLKWEYVRQNPVRAGLVKRPEDWPYQGEVFPLEL